MSSVKLPQIKMEGNKIDVDQIIDNQHTSPSSIFAYLGIRGLGDETGDSDVVTRYFNAIPYLGYWSIYKQYYSNKSEEIGAVIHTDVANLDFVIDDAILLDAAPNALPISNTDPPVTYTIAEGDAWGITSAGITSTTDPRSVKFKGILTINGVPKNVDMHVIQGNNPILKPGIFREVTTLPGQFIFENSRWRGATLKVDLVYIEKSDFIDKNNCEPKVKTFPLKNIDDMRLAILRWASDDEFVVDRDSAAPYGLPLRKAEVEDTGVYLYSQLFGQEGLAIKTYQSDLFNNWINTEWIDGENGISQVTSINTAEGSFTIDELNLKKKVYLMLNRIALSGGTYDDWLESVFDHKRTRGSEEPIYEGGLIRELVFDEVISNAAADDQPLGTLAGRGVVARGQKGGKIVVKCDEPVYIMGIVSITPRIDYSQGNTWHVNLKTMDDFHKPQLDEIGFQELVTEQMAWWDTSVDDEALTFKSAGKQPAWINYMTNVNKVYGSFAIQDEQMFMVLNRRYEAIKNSTGWTINDLTTYIDPVKFNHIFANTRRDAQNFWTQIGVNIEARRKMSAKIIPNL